jgi:septum formation topological specificity factor MinE
MNKIIKPLLMFALLIGGLPLATLQAAPRDASGNNKMVGKLQAMVKEMTVERDQLKTEKDKLVSDMEQLKKEKAAAASAEDRLNGELEAQKSSNNEVRNKLEQTHAKLLEVIAKYNALNQSKSELSATHANLQNTQKQTEAELQSCEGKNIKMFEAAKEILSRYEKKGVFDALLKSEPILQFKSVEIESIVQEYEDKLTKQKYQHKDIAVTKNSKQEPEKAKEAEQ